MESDLQFCMKKTNFDLYLVEQFRGKAFREWFRRAGEEWGVALSENAPSRRGRGRFRVTEDKSFRRRPISRIA